MNRPPAHTNQVELTGYPRQLLLQAVCRRLDPILYCNDEYSLNLHLTQKKGALYRGGCPWCRDEAALTLHRKTGTCRCASCGTAGDFLDLVCLERKEDLADMFTYLMPLVESYEQLDKKRRREAGRKSRQGACHG